MIYYAFETQKLIISYWSLIFTHDICIQLLVLVTSTINIDIQNSSEFDNPKFGLRIPDSYDAKIAKICNFWTFWPVIQLKMVY